MARSQAFPTALSRSLFLTLVFSFAAIQLQAAFGPWENHGPRGGTVTALVVGRSDPNILLAATYAGIYRSTDGGGRWNICSVKVRPGQLASSRGSTQVIYAAGDKAFLESTDLGVTWIPRTFPAAYGHAEGVAVHRSDTKQVYLATEDRFYRSTDSGVTWTSSTSGLASGASLRAIAVDPNSSTIYLGTVSSGVYKSTDEGDHWQAASSGLPSGLVCTIVVSPQDSNRVYAGGAFGLYKSTDKAATWQPSQSGLTASGFVLGISMPDTGSTMYVTSNAGVYKSTDQGGAWVLSTAGINDRFKVNTTVAINHSNTSILYVGTDFEGVYRSDDGAATWTMRSSNLNCQNIGGLFVDRANLGNVLVGAVAGIFRSTDGGLSWAKTSPAQVSEFVADPLHPNTLWAGQIGLHRSTDYGVTWQGLSTTTDFGNLVLALAIDPQNASTLYVGSSGGLFKSTASGQTWTKIWPASGTARIDRIVVNPASPQILYIVTNANSKIYKSTNGGAVWTACATGLPSDYVDDIDIDPVNPDRLLAAIDGSGVYRSTNGGGSWQAVYTHAAVRDAQRVVFDLDVADAAYALTASGLVFRTTNGGGVWTQVTPAMPYSVGISPRLAVSPFVEGRLFMGTEGGVWQQTSGIESTFYFPQVANGTAGQLALKTSLIFANTGVPRTVRVELFDSGGNPMSLAFGNSSASPQIFTRLKEGAAYSAETSGAGSLQVGYAKVHTPTGVGGTAVFSYSENGVTCYETGVPATTSQNHFTIFVDASGGIHDTGFALVNTGTAAASVLVRLYDVQGHFKAVRNLGVSMGAIAPGRHIALYASQLFSEVASLPGGTGVMTVESDQPLAAVTLRQEDNPNVAFPNDITKMCTLPVVPGRADQDNGVGDPVTFYFPQVANGQLGNARIRTSIVLVNTGGPTTAKIELFNQQGAPMDLPFFTVGSTSVIQGPVARGFAVYDTTTGTGAVKIGYAKVTTTGRVGGAAVFTYLENEVALYTAGVPASSPQRFFTMFMDAVGTKRNTGLAIAGTETGISTITFELYDKDRNLLATKTARDVLGFDFGAGFQMARFANEIFPIITTENIEEGVIIVRSDKPLAPVTLRACDDPALGFPEDIKLLTTFPVCPGAP